MQIQCVVFDMAGTTVNEDNLVYKTLQAAINHYNVPVDLDHVLLHGAGKEKFQAIKDIISKSPYALDEMVQLEAFNYFLAQLDIAYKNFKVTPMPGAEQVFIALKEKVRAELGDSVVTIALKVEQILTLCHDIQKRLKGKVDLAHVQSQGDIKQQLNELIFKGFVSRHGAARLDDILRYLQAMQKRLEKLPVDPQRDRLLMHEYQKAFDSYNNLLGKFAGSKVLPEPVQAIYWMLQELKVSLHAQQLGTPFPVSVKRVLHAVNEAKV